MKISILLTCYNRQEKTESCLRSLKDALEEYNNKIDEKIDVEIFLTDDGCTDCTAASARSVIPDEKVLHILQGNGNLYWAGGMRFAWKAALRRYPKWDYYLLINDDTIMLPSLFEELRRTSDYCVAKYGKQGIYTGFICDPKTGKMSFGGSNDSGALAPTGTPQECTYACANVMLIPQEVVDKIGIFDNRYTHAACDYDYAQMAIRANIPVLTTCTFVGTCENELRNEPVNAYDMPFIKRKAYMNRPTSGRRDYLLFVKKFWPRKYYASALMFYLELYLPGLFKIIAKKRRERVTKKFWNNAAN